MQSLGQHARKVAQKLPARRRLTTTRFTHVFDIDVDPLHTTIDDAKLHFLINPPSPLADVMLKDESVRQRQRVPVGDELNIVLLGECSNLWTLGRQVGCDDISELAPVPQPVVVRRRISKWPAVIV